MRAALSYGILFVVLLTAGCGPTEADKKALKDAYTRYGARDFAGTEELAGTYIKNEPGAENVDEAFYLRGIARYGRGDKLGAKTDLEKGIEKTKRNDLKYKAWATLGDIAFEDQKWDEAVAGYQKALSFAAGGKADVRLNYQLAVALQATGKWETARPMLEGVMASGDAGYTEKARGRVNGKAFGLQFGSFEKGPNAGELERTLKAAGVDARVVSELRGKQLVFLVRSAGSYTTWSDAELARRRVGHGAAIVVVE